MLARQENLLNGNALYEALLTVGNGAAREKLAKKTKPLKLLRNFTFEIFKKGAGGLVRTVVWPVHNHWSAPTPPGRCVSPRSPWHRRLERGCRRQAVSALIGNTFIPPKPESHGLDEADSSPCRGWNLKNWSRTPTDHSAVRVIHAERLIDGRIWWTTGSFAIRSLIYGYTGLATLSPRTTA